MHHFGIFWGGLSWTPKVPWKFHLLKDGMEASERENGLKSESQNTYKEREKNYNEDKQTEKNELDHISPYLIKSVSDFWK